MDVKLKRVQWNLFDPNNRICGLHALRGILGRCWVTREGSCIHSLGTDNNTFGGSCLSKYCKRKRETEGLAYAWHCNWECSRVARVLKVSMLGRFAAEYARLSNFHGRLLFLRGDLFARPTRLLPRTLFYSVRSPPAVMDFAPPPVRTF